MKEKNKIVFIIEDNSSVSSRLRYSIEKKNPNITVFEFTSVEDAVLEINSEPAVIVLDHFLEKTDGIDWIPLFLHKMSNVKIIVFSSQDNILVLEKAFFYGATSYFRKDALGILNVTEEVGKLLELKENSEAKKNAIDLKTSQSIYILEDNANVGLAACTYLQKETSYKTFSFLSSEEFFAALNKSLPGYVILDYHLNEEKNGLDVLKAIISVSKDIHVIILSNETDIEIAIATLEAGASHFLLKTKDNLEKIKSIINQKKRHEKNLH